MASRFRKLSMAMLGGGLVVASPLVGACSSIPFVGLSGEEKAAYEAWMATDRASGRINLQDVEKAFKESWTLVESWNFEVRVNEIYEGDGIVLFRASQTDSGDGERLTVEAWEDLNANWSINDELDERLFSIVKDQGLYEIQGYHANGYYNSRFGPVQPPDKAFVSRAYRSEDGSTIIFERWRDENRNEVIGEDADTLMSGEERRVDEPLEPGFPSTRFYSRDRTEDLLFTYLKLAGVSRGAYFYQTSSKRVGSINSRLRQFRFTTSYRDQRERNREAASEQQALVGAQYQKAALSVSPARQTYQEAVKSTRSFKERYDARYATVSCELYERGCPREVSGSGSDFNGAGGQVKLRNWRRVRRVRQSKNSIGTLFVRNGRGSVNTSLMAEVD
jgi:hypothetical protein